MKRAYAWCAFVVAVAIGALACRSSEADVTPIESGTNAQTNLRMQWWRDARFGLFIHWGLYAIPAGEWDGGTDYGEWIRDSAQIPLAEYEKLRARWNPTKFDPDAWARAAKDAGMGYVVITTKHHDGFCLFDSSQTDWDVMSTPAHRDVMTAMSDACRRAGLVPCWYHSIMDWHHPDYLPRRGWEKDRPADGADFDRYERYLDAQVTELLTHYGKIGVMWFDGEWESTWDHARGKRLYELCRRLQPEVIVNNRVDVGRGGMGGLTSAEGACGDFGTPEQEVPANGLGGVDWESCMTMNRHWGFNAHDQDFKSSRELIRTLVDIVSKGGNFLLNVGPTAEGEIPGACLERLAAIGKWMRVNGDAIHGTQASAVGAPAWGRVTVKPDGDDTHVYLHVFDWPRDGALVLEGLGNAVEHARLLADPGRELAAMSANGMIRVTLPARAPDADVSVVELVVRGAAIVYTAPRIETDAEIFVRPLEVKLVPSASALDVRYTLDGSEPTARSQKYVGPIRLAQTTTVTARSFDGELPVMKSVSRKLERVVPEPAIANEGWLPGLVYLTTLGDRTSVENSAGISITDGESLAEVEEQLQERTAATVGIPAEYLGRERVMLSFMGFVRVPADDVYTFALTSDDGAVLHVGERFVCDDDGLHSAVEVRGSVALAAGWHRFGLDWFNRTGNATLKLEMARAGEPLAPIPAADLAHDEVRVESGPAAGK